MFTLPQHIGCLDLSDNLTHSIVCKQPTLRVAGFDCHVGTGIGFAKSHQGNLELIRDLANVRKHLKGCLQKQPMLAGPSRKGFLGRLTGDSIRHRP